MTKKKPDFLRDLDTAIMDELTGGGIKGNAAGLVGTLTQIKEIKQLCGLPFCGYMAKLETVRPSGVPDEVTVVFAEDVPYRACNGIEFDAMQEFVEGSRLLLTGKVQTLKDFQSGRLLVYILADFVAVSEKAVEQDEAAVRGVIANKPTYRETPRGKRITDITVKVRNELTGGSCFLPCICWQEQADERVQAVTADTTTLTEKMRAALRISSTSEKITEEINDCIAACKADMKNDGVKVIKETDGLIIRAITLYCKAEFGFNNAAEQFRKSYDALKMRLSLSAEYNTAPQVSETDTNSTESGV